MILKVLKIELVQAKEKRRKAILIIGLSELQIIPCPFKPRAYTFNATTYTWNGASSIGRPWSDHWQVQRRKINEPRLREIQRFRICRSFPKHNFVFLFAENLEISGKIPSRS